MCKMPGYGKNLKRRGTKVSRKPKDQRVTRIKGNEVVRQAWKRGTLNENYQSFGLTTDPNAVVSGIEPTVFDKDGAPATKRSRKDTTAEPKAVKKSRKEAFNVEGPKVSEILEKSITDKDVDQETALTHHGLNERRRPPHWMSEEDCLFIGPLVEKYGTDYQAMLRDTKLNVYQHPTGYLKRKAERFVKFKETGLAILTPPKVGEK